MKDETLLKISLLTSIVGIFSLFIFLQLEEVETLSVDNFSNIICDTNSNSNLNDINIIGLVENINENNKTLLIDLVEYKKINQKAIMFKEDSDIIGINDGDIVEINGNWYNGKLIMNKIDRINISKI